MFFPSLPFMGVMLFPSFVLGNASGEGGASLALLSLFFFLLLLSFLYLLPFFLPFSPSPAFSSASLFLLSFYLSPLFFSPYHTPLYLFIFFIFLFFLNSLHPFSSFPLLCLLLILSFSFVPFFFFEGTACIECFSRCNRGHH